MAAAAQTEPWADAAQAGRDDGRLVRQAYEGAREASLVDDARRAAPGAARRAGDRRGRALYAHQAEALQSAWDGPTIVTTGTASGKSLCFNLPTLDVLCRDAKARALYLYPTKALAQDQARAISAARAGASGSARDLRRRHAARPSAPPIRRRSNLILTNPDMLHVGILPNHHAWADVFANLAVVVVDEAHVYRGVFGSHVANVLRRLRRIAAAYGTEPRILLASATIANPVELAERLTGLDDVALVDRDGSPGAARQIAMWNPPLEDEALGKRASTLAEAASIIAALVRGGARTICFIKSRKGVELVTKIVRDMLDPELAERVAPYRAGYTPQQRRELEARLMSGELHAVITTDALELGIDIGSLDAAVVATFPGTVASLRQMWGRAGRRGRGLAVYVAGEDALDQFFCRHPDEFLDRPVECAILDYENEGIHLSHLLCAAHEGPLGTDDAETLGPRWEAHAQALVASGDLVRRRGDLPPAPARGLPRRARLAALGERRLLRGHRRLVRRAARQRRGGARVLHRPPGRRLPAPRPLLRRARARPRRAPRARRAARRALVHAAEDRDADLDRGGARRARDVRADAALRPRQRDRDRHRLPAQEPARPRRRRPRDARPPRDDVRDAGALVRARRRRARPTSRRSTSSARCTPPSTARSPCSRSSRCATAGTSAGLSTNLHPQTGRADDLHLRRAPGRRRDHPRRARAVRDARRRRAPARQRVPVRVGLPVVRAVAEVRQPQRAALQGRLDRVDGAACSTA